MLLRNKKLQLTGLLGVAFVLAVSLVLPAAAVSNKTVISDNVLSATIVEISGDGSTVAFNSSQALVGSDTNGKNDLYVYDVPTAALERVSVNSSENQSTDGAGGINGAQLSYDGNIVVFGSNFSDLVSGDSNGIEDVFLRDRTAGITERISVDSSEAQLNGGSTEPSVSDDGRYVTFESVATNAVAGDSNGQEDIFIRDRTAGTTERVSINSSEAQATGGSSYLYGKSLSGDARYVVFTSEATDLVAGDTNGNADVFLRDRTAGTTVRVSVNENGSQNAEWSQGGVINRAGTHIAFSADGALVAADTNGTERDVYRYTVSDGSIHLVSSNSSGVVGNADSQFTNQHVSISSGGRYVLFESSASNLVAGGSFFIKDMVSGAVELVESSFTPVSYSMSDLGGQLAYKDSSNDVVLAWPDYATPVVPTNTALVGGGTSTTDTTPTFSGDCVAGDVITLYVDGQKTGATYTCNSFALTALALSVGYHAITFTATRLGNESAQSAVLGITILGAPGTGLKSQSSNLYIALSAVGAAASIYFARRLIIQKHAKKASSK